LHSPTQTQKAEIIYVSVADTVVAQALELMFEKLTASAIFRGESVEGTLGTVSGSGSFLAELMRLRSLDQSPHAALSRAIAGVRGQTLVLNLPGSPRAALEPPARPLAVPVRFVGREHAGQPTARRRAFG